ncbi:hypothetical protein [Nocardiopsis deserti]|nr:hypothetical protein [Nocardiopsis deserti]
MSDGCCTPLDEDPTPEGDRAAKIALGVVLTVGVVTLGGVVYLLI